MTGEKDETVERILTEELSEVAKTGARLGGAALTGLGGLLGGRLGAKMARTERADGFFRCSGDRKDLLLLLYAWFAKNGRLAGETDPHGSQVMGVLRGGLMAMNPVVLRVSLREMEEGAVEAHVEAFAKEGLLSQHTAEKAVTRFAEDLSRLAR